MTGSWRLFRRLRTAARLRERHPDHDRRRRRQLVRPLAQQPLVVWKRDRGVRARHLVQFPVGDLERLHVAACERTYTRAYRVDRRIVALCQHDYLRRRNLLAHALQNGVVDLVAVEAAVCLVQLELSVGIMRDQRDVVERDPLLLRRLVQGRPDELALAAVRSPDRQHLRQETSLSSRRPPGRHPTWTNRPDVHVGQATIRRLPTLNGSCATATTFSPTMIF